MKTFDVLDPNLDVRGCFFLEASAGTGKTFAIEHLICRLLLEGKSAIDQFLVVTFTRAATRELKQRIRNNLQKALSCLEKGDKDSLAYLQNVERETARSRLEAAIIRFEEAHVFTIHGFCQKMLADFPLEAQGAFGGEIGEYIAEKRRAIDEFLRGEIDDSYSGSQIDRLIRLCRGDIQTVKKRLLDTDDHMVKQIISWPESLDRLEKEFCEIGKTKEIDLSAMISDFTLLAPLYKKIKVEEHIAQVELLYEVLQSGSRALLEKLIDEKDLFLELWNEGNRKKRSKPPEENFLVDPSLFDELHDRIWPLLKPLRDPQQIFDRLAADFTQFWQERKQEKDLTTSDDFLQGMKRALGNRSFCRVVREKFKALIVDEFQDTDPLQWKIFQTLFFEPEPIAFIALVGDPKQSIYAFRSADIYTYLDAAKTVGSKQYLRTNFRSQVHLVNALNLLFSENPHWLSLPQAESSLPYHPVDAADQSVVPPFDDGRGSVHFFVAQTEIGRERKWPPTSVENDLFFPYIAQEIKDLIEKKGKGLDDFAILVKDRYQAERVFLYLQKQGFAATLRRAENLTQSELFSAFEHLFSAVVDPRGKAIHLLTTGPFLLWDQEKLLNAQENGELLEVKAALQNLGEVLEKHGLAVFLSTFFQMKFLGNTPLEILTIDRELSSYEDAMQIAELLLSSLGEGPVSAKKVFLFLRRLKHLSVEEEPLLRPRPSLEKTAIQIMTLHMSKGLEFPVVFALGVASRHMPIEQSPEVLAELDAEKMRQLYVALTRSAQRVYIPFFFSKEGRSPKLGEAAPIELFFHNTMGQDSFSSEEFVTHIQTLSQRADIGITLLEEKLSAPIFEKNEEKKPLLAPSSFHPHFTRVEVLSFTKLQLEKDAIEEPDREIEPTSSLSAGSETGIFLHKLLEQIFAQGLYRASKTEKRKALIDEFCRETPFEEQQTLIEQIVEKTLTHPIEDEQETFTLQEINSVLTEHEFAFSSGNDIVQGVIDLIAIYNGKVFLFDWKSNELGMGNYTLEGVEQSMHTHDYFLQAQIYYEALYSYFSALGLPFSFGKMVYVYLRAPFFYSFVPERYRQIQEIS